MAKLKNMSTQQLTPEELNEFQSNRSKLVSSIFELGKLEAEINESRKILDELNSEKSFLLSDISTLQEKQAKNISTIKSQYGENIEINPETGEIFFV